MVAPVVRIAFDLSLAGQGDFFTVGETPLGSGPPSLPLIGDALVDVSEDVRAVTVRRGRSRETDRFDAGTAAVTVANETRLYDPNYTGPDVNASAYLVDDPVVTIGGGGVGSPYAPSLIPRKELVIEAAGQRVFTGQVEDIDLAYSLDRRSETIFKAADGLSLLSRLNLTASATVTELTGDRVTFVLDDAEWPSLRRDINAGTASVAGASVSPDTNIIDYLNIVAQSEPGFIYVNRNGALTFRDKVSSQILSGYVFGDQPGDLRFSALEFEYGTEKLHTRIEVAWNGGTATAENIPAQQQYGLDTLKVTTFLSSSVAAQDLADFYSAKFSLPTTRLRSLEIEAHAYSSTDLGKLLSLELGSLVQFRFTPNGIGEPIQQALSIESIEHTFRPGIHLMKLSLSQGQAGFVLDESRLDEDILGF